MLLLQRNVLFCFVFYSFCLILFFNNIGRVKARTIEQAWIQTQSVASILWKSMYRHVHYLVGLPCDLTTALILNAINYVRCWKHSSESLVYVGMITLCSRCRFVHCMSMMPISCSALSQKCSIGSGCSVCGRCSCTENSVSCSRNQFNVVWRLWHNYDNFWDRL